MGRYGLALAEYDKVVELSPDLSQGYLVAPAPIGQWEGTTWRWPSTMSIPSIYSPDQSQGYVGRGDTYWAMGEVDPCWPHLTRLCRCSL